MLWSTIKKLRLVCGIWPTLVKQTKAGNLSAVEFDQRSLWYSMLFTCPDSEALVCEVSYENYSGCPSPVPIHLYIWSSECSVNTNVLPSCGAKGWNIFMGMYTESDLTGAAVCCKGFLQEECIAFFFSIWPCLVYFLRTYSKINREDMQLFKLCKISPLPQQLSSFMDANILLTHFLALWRLSIRDFNL